MESPRREVSTALAQSQGGCQAADQLQPERHVFNGKQYTYAEFVEFFDNDDLGDLLWDSASPVASESAANNKAGDTNSSSEHAPVPKRSPPLPYVALPSDHDQQHLAA